MTLPTYQPILFLIAYGSETWYLKQKTKTKTKNCETYKLQPFKLTYTVDVRLHC